MNPLLLTNRNNLVEFLTYGAIRPPSLMDKYYADLGDACPHALLVLHENPSTELSEHVRRDSPTAFPVLLELASESTQGGATVQASDTLPDCKVVPGVIPLSRVLTVHFRSATDLMEFQMRDFSDVRDHQVRTEITPERFEGRPVNVERLKSAAAEAGRHVQSVPPERLEEVNSLAGALLLTAAIAQQSRNNADFEPLRSALTMLAGSAEDPSQGLEYTGSTAGPLHWLALTPLLMLTPESPAKAVSHVVSSQGQAGAGVLFGVVLRYLAHLDPQQFVPRAAAADIRTWFQSELATIERADGSRLLELLDLINGVLRLTVEFDSFPISEEPVATALLYFLLRGAPEQVATWLDDSRVSDSPVILAGAYSGALFGRAGVPVALRGSAELERLVDELALRALVPDARADRAAPAPLQPVLTVVRERARKGVDVVQLRGPGGVLLSREVPAAAPAKSEVTPRDETKPRTRSSVSRKKGRAPATLADSPPVESSTDEPTPSIQQAGASHEDVAVLIERLIGGAETNPQIRRAALQLCRLARWDDCVITTIAIPPGRGYRFTGAPDGSLELMFPGFVQTKPRVRADRLRERLTPTAWARLPDSVRADVTTMLKETGPSAGA